MSKPAQSTCRVCTGHFFPEPLLRYDNMPKAAQHFPDANNLALEHGTNLCVWQCSDCGLVQLSEPPVPYYRDVIRASGISDPARALKTRQFGDLIQEFNLHGKKIIEIGCGHGEFLALWTPYNVDAYGVEHNPKAVEHCLAQGMRVTCGYPEKGHFTHPDAPFDAFVLLMFLEHMPDPLGALQAIHSQLADKSVGIIEVPNFDMVIRNKLFSEFIADHLLYFTRDTLTYLLQRTGFEILSYNELRNDYVLSVTVGKRQPHDLSAFHSAQARITDEIHQFIDLASGSVAIWGAGHQALSMICMAEIGEKISYIVDSAPFKQGKFTPASHLPVVPPERLSESPVAAIIVMAASYSDEVAAIIRKRFGQSMRLAILRESYLEVQ
jgi:SAM-dependent methyltransferase